MTDWQEFSQALRERDAAGKVKLEYGLAVPHVRTATVTKMVMAFGRLKEPVQETDGPIQFVVLVGIPETMDAEYLRLVGTLMRVFRSEKLRDKLLYAEKPAEIIDIFERVETGRVGAREKRIGVSAYRCGGVRETVEGRVGGRVPLSNG